MLESHTKLIRVEDVLPFLVGDCYLPKHAAAKYLGMSPRKLEGLREIERYRIGGMVYYRRSVLDKFMGAHAEAGQEEPAAPDGLRALLQQAKKRALAKEENI